MADHHEPADLTTLSRRRLLSLAAASAGGLILAACSDDDDGAAPAGDGADVVDAAESGGASGDGAEVEPDAAAGEGDGDGDGGGATAEASEATAEADCVLLPEDAEGPFYADLALDRRDITDGKLGSPLVLQLAVVDAATCQPIPDAVVDVWHADAGGLYSAFPGQGDAGDIDTSPEAFLRGIQTTDASGVATFDTIYPGWYPGRTTHIHLKVHFADQTRVTTQLYFPDEVSADVYTGHEAYVDRGPKDTANEDDGLEADQPALRMTLTGTGDGHTATHTLGIAR